MEERLAMTTQELDRLKVIHQVLQHKLTWPQAAAQLALSVRQVGRWCVRVRREGHRGILHRLRGRPSNHHLPSDQVAQAVSLVRRHYPDFGPTFANEKLRERHHLVLSTETLRKGMIREGIWQVRRQRVKHRAWRPRRSCVGELIQLDGSEHDWFEGRRPWCVFLLYIDDATSRLMYGEFVESEAMWTLFGCTKAYLEHYGRPRAFYVDKDSIYKINRQATIEEQLRDEQPLTQYTRAMHELEVEVIAANSPQAKGRVERSFDTHQDRLVKELRLAKISTLPEANRFVQEEYIPLHNAKFSVEPTNATNAHQPLLKGHDLERILSVRTPRILAKDFTLRCQNRFFQLLKEQPVRIRPGHTIEVEQRLDSSIHLRAKGRYLAFHAIPKPLPQRPRLAARLSWHGPRGIPHPPQMHPYKAASYQAMLKRKAQRAIGGYPQVQSFSPFPQTPIQTTTTTEP